MRYEPQNAVGRANGGRKRLIGLRAARATAGALALVAGVWVYQFVYESKARDLLRFSFVRVGLAVCMILFLCLCSSGGGTFIYFQF